MTLDYPDIYYKLSNKVGLIWKYETFDTLIHITYLLMSVLTQGHIVLVHKGCTEKESVFEN